MTDDGLRAAVRALPDSWRRPAVKAFLDRACRHAEQGDAELAAFWHALAIVVDDGIRDERATFAALTADVDPDAAAKGGSVD